MKFSLISKKKPEDDNKVSDFIKSYQEGLQLFNAVEAFYALLPLIQRRIGITFDPDHPIVLHIDVRKPAVHFGDAKVVVEPTIDRPTQNRFGEIPREEFLTVSLLRHPARLWPGPIPTQVPLADARRVIAVLTQKTGQGGARSADEWRFVGSDHPFL